MAVLQSGNLHTSLLVALVASASLAGCFDNEADPEPDDLDPLFERWQSGDEPIPLDALARYYKVESPEGCDGCLPLEERAPAPPPPPPPPVSIPWPQGGDVVTVGGILQAGVDHGRSIVARSDEDAYFPTIRVHAGPDGHARFETTASAATWSGHPLPLDVDRRDWNVSLASRTVGDETVAGRVLVGDGLRNDYWDADLRHEPTLETLFWLGAHVWGRDLRQGDVFTTHWVLPGEGDAVLRFDHRVHHAAHGEVPVALHHRHGQWNDDRVDVRVDVVATGPDGSRAGWKLFFIEESPYPLHMASIFTEHQPTFAQDLPMLVDRQRTELRARGSGELDWGETLVRPSTTTAAELRTFRLGERMAPAALDRLPAYPLEDALADLARFTHYDDHVRADPQRILVEASYETEREPGGAVHRHTWTLTLAAANGAAKQWSVSRLGGAAGVAPVPDAYSEHDIGYDAFRFLTDHATHDVRLADGGTLETALDRLDVDGADHMGYRVGPLAEGGIGARLWAARTLVPLADEGAALGYAEEDLGSFRLVTHGPIHRSS